MFVLNYIAITRKITLHFVVAVVSFCSFVVDPQWGIADAEIKVSSAENPERLNVCL